MLDWPAKDIQDLRFHQPLQFYREHLLFGDKQEIGKLQAELPEMKSIVAYMREVHAPGSTIPPAQDLLWLTAMSEPHEVQRYWPIPEPEGEDSLKLVGPSPGRTFYWFASRGHYNPLRFVPFDTFQRVGFAF
jgi:hypothetical protein